MSKFPSIGVTLCTVISSSAPETAMIDCVVCFGISRFGDAGADIF